MKWEDFEADVQLSEDEKMKAETILGLLEGMSIVSAGRLLEKCLKLLFGSRVSVPDLKSLNQRKKLP